MPENAIERALERVRREPAVIRLDCDSIAVLGDTHGYIQSTQYFLGKYSDIADCLIVLGDTVDRGPHGVENLELVAERLADDPRFYLLRGNHESLMMNKWYGFYEEALRKRDRDYLRLVNELYINLPVAAVWKSKEGEGVLLVHGGIPCRVCRDEPEEPVNLEELADHLNRVKGTPDASAPRDGLMFQLLWNDPRRNLDWFGPNMRGPGTYYYGIQAWKSFLDANNLHMIVRAHETVDGVLIYKAEGRRAAEINLLRHGDYTTGLSIRNLKWSVVTVFSSFYHGLRAAALLLDGDHLQAEEIPRP